MNHLLTNAKFTTLSIIFLVAFISNAFIFKSPPIAIILLFFFLALFALPLGRGSAPQESHSTQILFGLFVAFSAIAIVGSAIFYLATFTKPAAITMVLLALPLAWLVWQRSPKAFKKIEPGHDALSGQIHSTKNIIWITIIFVIALLTVSINLILKAATEKAINSPWEVISPIIFLIFGSAIILLIALLLRARERALVLPLVSVALFVFITVVLFVFPIGYGFDSFIHQATENHIAEFGTITPKPFYYVGQYSIILFLHQAFLIPIEWADKLLVPVLTALLLPLAWFSAAAHLLKDKKSAMRSLVFIFLIPLTSFIVTTPQGLGNLWFLLLILLAIPRLFDRDSLPIWPLVIGTITALLIHPIAGIPACLFLVLLAANPNDPKQKYPKLARVFSWFVILFGSFAIPASFVINSLRSGKGLGFDFSALAPTTLVHSLHLDLFFENRFSPILDFVYLFGWNQVLLLFIGAAIGMVWLWRGSMTSDRRDKGANGHSPLQTLQIHIVLAIVLFINFIVIGSAVDFSFLIDYERGNYAARLVPLAVFCLIPFLIIFAGRWLTRIQEKPAVLRVTAIIFLTALITSAFYFNYPRKDAYETNHGFNVSRADISAVIDIDHQAAGTEYIVLANQSTSAAALREFGFAHYYGDQFYYPIPTGNPLYQFFLDMNEHPTKETALAAMDLIGVDRVYFLVSDYWWQAERIVETTKTTADNWWSVENGQVVIFEYGR